MIIPLIMAGVAAASAYATYLQQQRAQQNALQQAMIQQNLARTQMGQQDAQLDQQQTQALRSQAAQQQAADRQYALATAGTTNARGDTTRYVPGVGWVEELSAASRALQGASDTEAAQRLNVDLPRAREGREMNFDARMNERASADRLMREYESQQPRSAAAIESAMIERNVAAANDPIDAARRQVQINALRGNTGAGETLAALSREGARGTRSAIAEARLAAPGAAQEEAAAASGNTLNQYNTMATRASNIDDVPFDPQNIVQTLAARGQAQAGNAGNELEGASRAQARGYADLTRPPTFRPLTGMPSLPSDQPNLGMLVAGVGQAGMDAWDGYGGGSSKPTGWKLTTPTAGSSGGGGWSSGSGRR